MVLAAFLDTHTYSVTEVVLYTVGFLGWTPAYAAILWIGFREHRLEIPVLAATGNITWELLWGFGFTQNMGWGLQVVYQGAFLVDVGILVLVFRYGRDQTAAAFVRRWFVPLLLLLLGLWTAFHVGVQRGGVDTQLGTVSAYLVSVAESGVYLWVGLSILNPWRQSLVVAWSKFVGTAFVTGFVFLEYAHRPFVQTIAVIVGVLDVAYLVVLYARRSAEPAASFSRATSSSGLSPAP